MAKSRQKTVAIHFPTGGLNKRHAYRQQSPYTTPLALNVRPDSFGGRERGGTRPGLVKAFRETLGGPPTSADVLSTLGTNLKAYWELDELSGTRYDATANDNDLTDNNTVLYAAGLRGLPAADFEQSASESLSITDAAQTGLDITGAITLAAWVKPESFTNDYAGVICKHDTNAQRAYALVVHSNGDVRLLISSNGVASSSVFSTDVLPLNEWSHIAAVYSGTNIGVYINGKLAATPVAYSSGIHNSSAPVRVGARDASGSPTAFFDGLIAKAGVWATGFTAAQIQWLYSQGQPVRAIEQVTYLDSNILEIKEDHFQGDALGTNWSTASWASGGLNVFPENIGDLVYSTDSAEYGIVRDAYDDLNTGAAYMVSIYIVPWQAQHWGTYYIYARMDDDDPDATDTGVIAELTLTADGEFSGNLYDYDGGTLQSTTAFLTGDDTYAAEGWFDVLITTNNVKCYWRKGLLCNKGVTAHTGTAAGFGMAVTGSGAIGLVDTWRVQWTKAAEGEYANTKLIASAGGILYKEAFAGELEALYTNATLADDRFVMSQEYLQKVYLADSGDYIKDAITGTVTAGVLDDTNVSDWTALGISVHDHVVQTYNGTNVTDAVYAITSIDATNGLTLTGNSDTGTCSYRICRTLKVYDPSDDSLTNMTATAGDVPPNCPIISYFNDRLVLAKDHIIYMSKQGDEDDWDYALDPDNPGKAFATTLPDAGRTGTFVTAICSHTDDYLVVGCRNSLWVFRGDPGYGGQLDNLSRNIGIIDRAAWCHAPDGSLFFLSLDGLYLLPPGGNSPPISVSREVLPEALLNVDTNEYFVQLVHDVLARGIHIYLTSEYASSEQHWFYDWEAKSFWPEEYQRDHEPTAVHNYQTDVGMSNRVLIGGRDGYIRGESSLADSDEENAISSYVLYGPMRIGGTDMDAALLCRMVGTLAENSGPVKWSVYADETHEAVAHAATADATGAWIATYGSQGMQHIDDPRVRGGSHALKLENYEGRRWAIESIALNLAHGGMQRL